MAVARRKTPSGKTRYAAKWRDPATGKWVEKRFLTKTEARSYDEARKARANTPLAESTTVTALVDLFKQTHYPMLSKATRVWYDKHFDLRIIPALGNKRLSKLTTLAIQGWFNELAVSPPTANATLRALKGLLGRGVEWGILASNPAKAIRPLPVEKNKAPRVVPAKTVQRIANACPLPRDKTLVSLLLGSGLRIGEACALQWDDVDGRFLKISRAFDQDGSLKAPKSYAHRRVPMLETAAAELERWREHAHPVWVFARDDGEGPMRPDVFRKIWDKARIAAKAPTVRIHDLRHTYASLLVDRGVDVRSVQAWLGHSSPVTTMRLYAHLSRDDAGVLAKLDG